MSIRVISIEEAADISPFGKSTLYRAALKGDGPFRKVAGRWVAIEDDFIAWIRGELAHQAEPVAATRSHGRLWEQVNRIQED